MSDLAHRSYCVGTWHPHRDDCTCGLALRRLASNLAIAAALCRAFRLGYNRCADNFTPTSEVWIHGCNRPAP